jgi:hypothetical protein
MSQDGSMSASPTDFIDDVTIRRARPDHAVAMLAVYVASNRGVCFGSFTPKQIAAWAAKKHIGLYERAIATVVVFVAVAEDDTLVGFGDFDPVTSEVRALYLDPCLVGRGVRVITYRSSLNAVRFQERVGDERGAASTSRLPASECVKCSTCRTKHIHSISTSNSVSRRTINPPCRSRHDGIRRDPAAHDAHAW